MPWGCRFLADLVLPSELGSPASLDVSSRLHTLTSKSTQGALTSCEARGSELYLRHLATPCLHPLHVPLGRSFISFSSPALQALALTKRFWTGYSNTHKDVSQDKEEAMFKSLYRFPANLGSVFSVM